LRKDKCLDEPLEEHQSQYTKQRVDGLEKLAEEKDNGAIGVVGQSVESPMEFKESLKNGKLGTAANGQVEEVKKTNGSASELQSTTTANGSPMRSDSPRRSRSLRRSMIPKFSWRRSSGEKSSSTPSLTLLSPAVTTTSSSNTIAGAADDSGVKGIKPNRGK